MKYRFPYAGFNCELWLHLIMYFEKGARKVHGPQNLLSICTQSIYKTLINKGRFMEMYKVM